MAVEGTLLTTVDFVLRFAGIVAAIAAPILIARATRSSAKDASLQAHELDRHRRREAEDQELESVLWAIHAEIVTVVAHYHQAIGSHLQRHAPHATFYDGYMLAEEDYFTVYENSSAVLGRLHDRELLLAIVRAYTTLRRVIDAHRLQRKIVETAGGRVLGQDEDQRAKNTKRQLLDLHEELNHASDQVVLLLQRRHGQLDQPPHNPDTSPPQARYTQSA